MTVYFDTCALSRLTDDLSQPRVRREAEAMARIFDLIAAGKVVWLASNILRYEIERNPDPIRRIDSLKLLSNAAQIVAPTPSTIQRANALKLIGLTDLDALHLAVAEQVDADSLITTDDRFQKQAVAGRKITRPEIVNPVDWMQRRYPWLLPDPPAPAR